MTTPTPEATAKLSSALLEKLKAAFTSVKGAAGPLGAKAVAMGTKAYGARGSILPALKGIGADLATIAPKAALSAGAGLGMAFGPQLIQAGGDAVEGADEMITHRRFERTRNLIAQNRRDMLLQQMEEQRLQSAMQMNEMRLQQLDPHLYAELQAGRRLARGAVPIGGQARRDLIEEVTRGMAQGRYGPPQMQMQQGPYGGM